MALLKVIVLHVRERAVAPALIVDGLLEQLYRAAEAFGPIRRAFLILRKLRYAWCVILGIIFPPIQLYGLSFRR